MCLFFHFRSEWDGQYKGGKAKGRVTRDLEKKGKAIKINLNAKTVDFLLIRNVAKDLIPQKRTDLQVHVKMDTLWTFKLDRCDILNQG
jgi:hypothetical protein